MIDHSESVVRHYSAANLTQKIAAIMSSMLPDDRPLTVWASRWELIFRS